jgi:hypothetical protein
LNKFLQKSLKITVKFYAMPVQYFFKVRFIRRTKKILKKNFNLLGNTVYFRPGNKKNKCVFLGHNVLFSLPQTKYHLFSKSFYLNQFIDRYKEVEIIVEYLILENHHQVRKITDTNIADAKMLLIEKGRIKESFTIQGSGLFNVYFD